MQQVQAYFSKVRRPEGTFELHSSRHKDRIERIAKLPRELCARCKGRKCVYCGECGGLRMPAAADLLPDRIDLPFDVLLMVHWNESLHKCTGIHSAVLSTEGSVEVCAWPNEAKNGAAGDESVSQEKRRLVAGLDSDNDLLLFPSKDAVVADDVAWLGGADGGGGVRRKRLVVLEATWQHGKVLARELRRLRGELGLPPLRFVTLKADVVGQYWRFHNEGHSAVSTIEAICHTAVAAGLPDRSAEDFLFLFYLQKYRLLERIKVDGKQPRAIDVTASAW
jgi:DTW domain-containing protein YfiP